MHKKWPKSCLFCFFFIKSQEVENRDYEHCKSILGKFRWNVLTGLSLTVHTVTDRYFLQNWWFQHYSFHWVIWVNFTKPIWTFENPSFVQSIKFPNFFKKWDFLTIFVKQSQFCKVLPPWIFSRLVLYLELKLLAGRVINFQKWDKVLQGNLSYVLILHKDGTVWQHFEKSWEGFEHHFPTESIDSSEFLRLKK